MESLELYVCPVNAEGDIPIRDQNGAILCTVWPVGEDFNSPQPANAEERAARIIGSVNAVNRIVALLDDTEEWDSETMGDLANILHDEGFKLREPENEDAE